MKYFTSFFMVLGVLLLGIVIGWFFKPNFNFIEQKKEEKATVILEKIRNVTKLITVEGSLSEIYSYQDYYSYDISPLRKKALVRVTAKVSAGYDFEKMQVNINPATKTIEINNFPPPEILSVDHDIDYYDLTEGVFNSFEKNDFNKINKESKERIIQAANESTLLTQAEEQKLHLLELIQMMVGSSDYKLVVRDANGLNLLQLD